MKSHLVDVFPYDIEVSFAAQPDRIHDIIDWFAAEHLVMHDDWKIHYLTKETVVFSFKKMKDALSFKLIWS